MRIDVVGRHMDITDTIREHAEKKGEKLTRYFDRTQQVTFTISKGDGKPEAFNVECVVDVEYHPAFVASEKGADLYAVIDETVQKAGRQLTDFKEKLKLENR